MMEKENVRALQKMPPENKLAYCKLLALMISVDSSTNQLVMAEFYRLMANIRLSTSKREEILIFLVQPDKNVDILCGEMLESINQQEKNILRFSLIKDLMIIIGADYVETTRENQLLKELEELLNITEEQKSFLVEEYQQDQNINQEDQKNNIKRKLMKETIAKSIALGVPLSVVGFSGLNKGYGGGDIIAGLQQLGARKYTKRYSSAVGLGVTILTAFSTYHLIKWLMNNINNNHNQLKDLIQEEMNLIHQRAIKYLEKDIEVFSEEKKTEIVNSTQIADIRDLLIKTIATLKNTKPKII